MAKPITLVIPLVPKHDQYLPDLLSGLGADRVLIDKVVLARSELPSWKRRAFSRWADDLAQKIGVRVETSSTSKRCTAGINRNRGWQISNSMYTAFVDADDSYSASRLHLLLNVAEEFNSNLVLHDYWLPHELQESAAPDIWGMDEVVQDDVLLEATFPVGRDRHSEGRNPGDTNINVPPMTREQRVAHGHTLVRTDIYPAIRFGPIYPGEDGQFCRDVLWFLGRVSYVPARLAVYNYRRSAGTSVLNRIRKQLGRH